MRTGGRWRVLTPGHGVTGWEAKSIVETPDWAIWIGSEDGITRDSGNPDQVRLESAR